MQDNIKLCTPERLLYATTRIECLLPNNNKSVGTGFFFDFNFEEGCIPTLITNKHVVENSIEGTILLHIADDTGHPVKDKFFKYTKENFEKQWIMHPDNNVDLCILPIARVQNNVKKTFNVDIFHVSFNCDEIATQDYLDNLIPIEDVIMMGYPNSLWDEKNNRPIARKGITATHPGINYNGKQEFLIDVACFPGSSGSPVLLYNPCNYIDRFDRTFLQPRVKFLGILYAGPLHRVQSTNKDTFRIPNNLGVVINAYKILDFIPLLDKFRANAVQV